MSADQRVTFAREFLAGARRRKVAELPPSVLARELAECRRQLGQVLDVIAGNAPLTDAQREVLRQALGDAIAWHEDPEPCASCRYMAPGSQEDLRLGDAGPGGDLVLCAEHAEAVAQRDAYIRLARELGIEVRP